MKNILYWLRFVSGCHAWRTDWVICSVALHRPSEEIAASFLHSLEGCWHGKMSRSVVVWCSVLTQRMDDLINFLLNIYLLHCTCDCYFFVSAQVCRIDPYTDAAKLWQTSSSMVSVRETGGAEVCGLSALINTPTVVTSMVSVTWVRETGGAEVCGLSALINMPTVVTSMVSVTWVRETGGAEVCGLSALINTPTVVTLHWWTSQQWSPYTDEWANGGYPTLIANGPTVVTLHWWTGQQWSPYADEWAIGGHPTLLNWPSVVTLHW